MGATGNLDGIPKIIGKLTPVGNLSGFVKAEPTISGRVASYTTEYYDGSYEIEPTDEGQIVKVEGYKMGKDITIMPIPSNYGLITRVGTRLNIS